jgi:hypothetical protein
VRRQTQTKRDGGPTPPKRGKGVSKGEYFNNISEKCNVDMFLS